MRSKRVVIIGGGPAGCTAAILLGRRGYDVTIVEQHRFPRDKVCGECLSATGIKILESLQLRRHIESAEQPRKLVRSVFFADDGSRLEVPLPAPMWGISRRVLDAILLNETKRSCRVLQPARCERVESSASGCEICVRSIPANMHMLLRCDWAFVADGKGSLLPDRPTTTRDFGVKAHWSGVDAPPDAIELFGVDSHYGGIAPVEDGRFNLSFSVPVARLGASHGDLDRMFDAVVRQNPELRRQLRNASRSGPWLSSPLPRFGVAACWPPRVIPLGNAAAAVEPIGGEGMGLAMCSAKLAADELIAAEEQGRPVDTASIRRQFQSLWRTRQIACRAAASIISRRWAAAPMIDLFNCAPGLLRPMLHLIGKK